MQTEKITLGIGKFNVKWIVTRYQSIKHFKVNWNKIFFLVYTISSNCYYFCEQGLNMSCSSNRDTSLYGTLFKIHISKDKLVHYLLTG